MGYMQKRLKKPFKGLTTKERPQGDKAGDKPGADGERPSGLGHLSHHDYHHYGNSLQGGGGIGVTVINVYKVTV